MSDTNPAELRARLSAGAAGADPEALRTSLGLASDADDSVLAVALVRRVSAAAIPDLPQPGESRSQAREDASRILDNRTSYLVRLTKGTAEPGLDLQQLSDGRTLLAVCRGGTLFQRRAAILRLGELVDDPRDLAADQLRSIVETLAHLRRFDVAYELSQVCARLPGAAGRRARAGRREWDELTQQVLQDVAAFWDGERVAEPLGALHGDQRAQLLARCRDLPDVMLAHICAVVEQADGTSTRAAGAALLSALQNAGDRRLLPTLRAITNAQTPELMLPAVRALSRIEDPRVHPQLKACYERAVIAEQRIVLAGALAIAGDTRGLSHVREMLASDPAELKPAVFEALAELGTGEDAQGLPLDRLEGPTLQAALRTVERIGDSRSLVALARLEQSTSHSAVRAAIEEAGAAIHARMELLGEEAAPHESASEVFDTAKMAVLKRSQDPALVRVRARWSLLVAHLWAFVGSQRRAVTRFETAAALRPEWVAPVLSLALLYSRFDRTPQALASYRRALEIDRPAVERNGPAVRALAQAFLRRAEAVERDGRHDIAFGLLEEVLALDLRRAPSGLRFALSQRHDALRSREA